MVRVAYSVPYLRREYGDGGGGDDTFGSAMRDSLSDTDLQIQIEIGIRTGTYCLFSKCSCRDGSFCLSETFGV